MQENPKLPHIVAPVQARIEARVEKQRRSADEELGSEVGGQAQRSWGIDASADNLSCECSDYMA